MSHNFIDRLADMQIFTLVAEVGSFSQVARQLNMAPSSISKLIARLETRLRIRLMHRTTRKIILTEEGQVYYQRALGILADIEEAESLVTSRLKRPRGRVRITCCVPFSLHQLIPLFPELMSRYPEIEIDLISTDNVLDLLETRCDIAIRIGPLPDSSLKMRKLAESKMLLVATPDYLKRFGYPLKPQDLVNHRRLNFSNNSGLNRWLFANQAESLEWPAKGTWSANDGESIRAMVLAGGGIGRLSAFMIRNDIDQGKLMTLLDDWNPDDKQSIYLLHLGHPSARVEAVIDYLHEKLAGKNFT